MRVMKFQATNITGGTLNHHDEIREYYRLCDEAKALNIPTSLDDPASPRTVEGLRAAVEAAKA